MMAELSVLEKTNVFWEAFWRKLTPPQLFVGSFLLLVAFGTFGLKVIPGLYTGQPLTWLNALFTATSATCVTARN